MENTTTTAQATSVVDVADLPVGALGAPTGQSIVDVMDPALERRMRAWAAH